MVKRLFEIGAVCSTGLKKPVNQDRILAIVGEIKNEEFGIFAVADGVGGMDFGEYASEYVIYSIKKWWETRLKELICQPVKRIIKQVDIELEELLQKLNRDIYQYGISCGQKGGTTLSLIFIYKNLYILKHTGDSRIYVLGSELIQLTRDQSWTESTVDRGKLSKGKADINQMKNTLTMCLGVFDNLELQTLSGVLPGTAIIIICSDGFYRYFNSQELKEAIKVLKEDTEVTAQGLSNELLKKVISKGACDNISLIIVNPGKGVI